MGKFIKEEGKKMKIFTTKMNYRQGVSAVFTVVLLVVLTACGSISTEETNDEQNITDVTAPIITLNGESIITLEQNTAYTELGATALDVVDGNVSVNISGTVDTATVGNYVVTYSAQDTSGNEANTTRTITVIDVTPPVLTLNGEANITLEQDAVYTEPGATALDGVDGNVSVSISGTVDTSIVGSYTVTYTATDSAGNEANVTRSVEVINVTPILSSLSLESNATTVNVAETVQLSVVGTYSDNSTKVVDENITYIITPVENAEVNGSVLTALKDGNVTVQAKVGTTLSNTIDLNITWVVNGHTLPPEPDPVENDATLLGVDSNNDGVRDDIERKVYATYSKAIQRAVMMQAFREKQKMLADPDMLDNARIWAESTWRAFGCKNYLADSGKMQYIKSRTMSKYVDNNQFNTKERVKLYIKYNQALSGGVYSIQDGTLQDCEFNTDKVLEMDK